MEDMIIKKINYAVLRITDNGGKGWAIQYRPLVSKAKIYASIVFPCYNQPY